MLRWRNLTPCPRDSKSVSRPPEPSSMPGSAHQQLVDLYLGSTMLVRSVNCGVSLCALKLVSGHPCWWSWRRRNVPGCRGFLRPYWVLDTLPQPSGYKKRRINVNSTCCFPGLGKEEVTTKTCNVRLHANKFLLPLPKALLYFLIQVLKVLYCNYDCYYMNHEYSYCYQYYNYCYCYYYEYL